MKNAAGAATAEYFGGSVSPNPKVYVVWWGDPSKINSAVTATTGGIADFFTGVLNSPFMDWLNEYDTSIPAQAGSHKGMAGTGQHIGRGNYVGAITLTNIPTGNVSDAQIQTALEAGLTSGLLPPADDNTIYAVYFPSGVTISLDGSSSCSGFGAYHEAIIETPPKHDAYYLVMPDCGAPFKNMTSVSTHELVEALTDNIPTPASSPDYPQAWNDAMGNEMGDLCNASGTVTTPLGMFTVQTIWDERTKACKTFSNDANDYSVAVSPNVAKVDLGASTTYTVQTTTSAGTAQMLTLSATAPSGVTATISPTTIMSGSTATLTVVATSPPAQTGLQVVVRADATATQTHTAALLLSTSTFVPPPDLGSAPADLGAPAHDLAVGGGGGGGGGGGDTGGDDMASGNGTGGNGQPPPSKGCSYAGAASAHALDGAWPLAGLALALLLALRRRARRA